jgi:hypothetical protein
MLRLRLLLPLFALLWLGLEAPEAKKAPVRKANVVPADCKVMADSLEKLYEAGDPAYLTWDISPKCDSSLLYKAYYYQGVGFYLLSSWKESLYFLSLAKDIGGPRDEEILFHLWNVNRKLDRNQEMERATLELHQRYPNSFFLMEILDQWKSVDHPTRYWTMDYNSKVTTASSPYLDNMFSNRFRVSSSHKIGAHRFRETGSLSTKTKLGTSQALQSFQGNIGGEYEFHGLTLEANYGASYENPNDSIPVLLLHSGLESHIADSNWNLYQGNIGMGYSYQTKSGWNLNWKASMLQLSKDWKVIGLSHSESFLFPSWILLGYIDYQTHWFHVDGDSILGGMNTFMVNLTPLVSWDRHSVSIGPTYYVSLTNYGRGGLYEDHSITASMSYAYDLLTWMKINLNASYGREFLKGDADPKYLSEKVYSLDAGLSFSF